MRVIVRQNITLDCEGHRLRVGYQALAPIRVGKRATRDRRFTFEWEGYQLFPLLYYLGLFSTKAIMLESSPGCRAHPK